MPKKKIPNKLNTVDNVRASRDGHEYHEAWTARRALQLLCPTDKLVGIALEGLHPIDQSSASQEIVEVADTTLYFGVRPTFKLSEITKVAQFKYSHNRQNIPLRISDVRITVKKFAKAFKRYEKKYGARAIQKKLFFEIVTNRPIYSPFQEALQSLAEKKPATGEIKKQIKQIELAAEMQGKKLADFAAKVKLVGRTGNLQEIKQDISRTLVDWSATSDPLARARLHGLKQLVRNKSQSEGQDNNIITLTDVLAALEIEEVEDLLPCPTSFPKVGPILEREQLPVALEAIIKLNQPLLIHSDGGVGKTVFIENLASILSNKHEVVIFDCFGGGAYRAPDDARHLPKKGLVHIANILAARGLCDPLLPNSDSIPDLIKTFRRRVEQVIRTMRVNFPKRKLVLFIDAIDNAAEHAESQNEVSFTKILLESLEVTGRIDGFQVVVTCRSHRIKVAKGNLECEEIMLRPFVLSETKKYLMDRMKGVTQTGIKIAQSRSGGNARILEYLVKTKCDLLDSSEVNKKIELDELLRERIKAALAEAISRGYSKDKIKSFLAGLVMLPPPVPIDEFALAQGISASAVRSFASDLAPLVERTKHGLMFRDEPTETLVREEYGASQRLLRNVAGNLLREQNRSFYAARTLPNLLRQLKDGRRLFELAYDERFPSTITSAVGKRNIRYARLKAAVLYCVSSAAYDDLAQLTVELSTIASVDQRGTDYILNNPDLIIAARDLDATRRLFETRTSWPGMRHARLAIAHTLSGDDEDASRHAVMADEWIWHFRESPKGNGNERLGPECEDVAALPLWLISQKRHKRAAAFLRDWKDWYCFEVCKKLISYMDMAASTRQDKSMVEGFIKSLSSELGVIVGFLYFAELKEQHRRDLVKKLIRLCGGKEKIEYGDEFSRRSETKLQDGMLGAAAIAVSIGNKPGAAKILNAAPLEQPRMWIYQDPTFEKKMFNSVAQVALKCIIQKRKPHDYDLLPQELKALYKKTPSRKGSNFREKLLKLIDKAPSPQIPPDPKSKESALSFDDKQNATRFVNGRLIELVKLTSLFSDVLQAPLRKAEKEFRCFVKGWEEASNKVDYSDFYAHQKILYQKVWLKAAVFLIRIRSDLSLTCLKSFVKILRKQSIYPIYMQSEIIAILSKRNKAHEVAGEEAVRTAELIENEDNVMNRAEMFAELGRAILPASEDEASAYFKKGLEQIDAIGSGDYEYVNELLIYVSCLKGKELNEQEFHTLSNICELNMYESEKFPWYAYGKALSKTSGCRGLARLSRWDDRGKVSVDYTLLPYLTALISDDKITCDVALPLLRLSDPVELYSCGTEEMAKEVARKSKSVRGKALQELTRQYLENISGMGMNDTIKTLMMLARANIGSKNELYKYMRSFLKVNGITVKEYNDNMNCHESTYSKRKNKAEKKQRSKLLEIGDIVKKTNPLEEESVKSAIEELKLIRDIENVFGVFFGGIRKKVKYSERGKYVALIAGLENLNIYTKFSELKHCKAKWDSSSTGLRNEFKKIAVPILQLHSVDFVSHDKLSGYHLDKLAKLTGKSHWFFALELMKLYAKPEWEVSASVWLGLGSALMPKTKSGAGQKALTRLLNREADRLASSVQEGKWAKGMYPDEGVVDIAARFVWRMLGAPYASERWQAAHTIRRFAKNGRWDIINKLVKFIDDREATPFQAQEFKFYYLHANLWLLISLARIAHDYPRQIFKYYSVMLRVINEKKFPHVLMKHFAKQCILKCVENGNFLIPKKDKDKIVNVNVSRFPRLRTKKRIGVARFTRAGGLKRAKKSKKEFYLDYDFEKYKVSKLADVFGRSQSEVVDLICETVRKFDKNITHMHDRDGRVENQWDCRNYHMTSRYHSYGQQLGWHSLYIVAAHLLENYQITDDSYEDEPWEAFINSEALTRKDGLWLCDGTDYAPTEMRVNLLEKGKKEVGITGDKFKLLNMIESKRGAKEGLVVDGSWKSVDGITVNIGSVLVAPNKARTVINELLREKPFMTWLPSYAGYEKEYLESKKKDCTPWLVSPSVEFNLDKNDPLASKSAMQRARFAKSIREEFALKSDDPFYRRWKRGSKVLAWAHSWGDNEESENDRIIWGARLVCSKALLKEILNKKKTDLIVLVKLQRYEKGIGSKDSKFSNTVAVIHVNKNMIISYHKGSINKVHESR